MYKVLTISGEDYKFEFSLEASLYNDCIERITSLMLATEQAGKEGSNTNVTQILSGLSNLPSTALHCFYAGLLEHHGNGYSADGRVTSINIAKSLIAQMFRDEECEYNNWSDILALCIDQMTEDGFFELIGLTEKKKMPKVPQDHKKKTPRKVSEN